MSYSFSFLVVSSFRPIKIFFSPTQCPKLATSSKRLNTLASAIGLKPKKTATPVEEPPSPVLPIHTGDIDPPSHHSKLVHKPVSVAVGWSDPHSLQPPLSKDFVDSYPQSVFSTDLDPFAAAKYSDCSPNVSDSLRFSTFSEVSTLESHVRKDSSYPHNRMSFASSSSLSHQRSDVTSDSSPVSSPLLSPVIPGRHLSRLTVESERMFTRESSLVSPVSTRNCIDEQPFIVTSPSSATLTDFPGQGTIPPLPKTRPRGFTDVRPSRLSSVDSLASDQKISPVFSPYNFVGPRVVIRQPSSNKLQSIQPPTAPPATELPPAPESPQQDDFSLLPAFPEHISHSAASSSSSLSFASSTSSRFDPLEAEGRRRDLRRLKDAKKAAKSRPSSPSKDTGRDVRDPSSQSSNSRREFSPTRTLKKAMSIQNLPKKSLGMSAPTYLPVSEDTKPLKKQRSFHHTRIPMPPLPASLKQASSFNPASARDALSVPEDHRVSAQPSPKSPSSSPGLNPTYVRRRLFSGTSLRRPTSSQLAELDDDTQSTVSVPSVTSPLGRPQINLPPVLNKRELSSFWDEETPSSPGVGNEPQEYAPQQILSAADILKFENMVREGENLSGFVRSRGSSFTSVAASKHSARTTPELATSVSPLSPSSVMRPSDPLVALNGRSSVSGRPRARGNSLQSKVGDVTNGRSQAGSFSTSGQTGRALSFLSLNGLPLPPRSRVRPSTSSGSSSPATEYAPPLATGDRSSVVLMPLSPPPTRRNTARRVPDTPPSASPVLRPGISRRPSFLDMMDDADREPSPPGDSFLDMGKASLDTFEAARKRTLVSADS
ncbi:hypothetical protein B0F90DRAFT_1813487 [Multifurca ochricompacta]|uniref:Uncharacterized protein n=1 Tax=Multifurca ochricompacta TaxID=376703 RepID=A0AAD4MD58_9AGAM|nr:hypothetical protein B0F90DRAFT_1813487 [Multifurca ochricompacta]